MSDLTLAWRNIWRHPRRSILTMMAIGFASMLLVFMLSFQFGSYEDMIDASVRLATGHIQVQAPGFNEKPEIRKVVKSPAHLINRMKNIPDITSVSPRCQAFVLASSDNRTRGIMVMGVNPESEPTVSRLPSLIRSGTYLSKNTPDTIIIGDLLAHRLKVTVGNELTLLGQALDGSIAATVMTICGVFESGIDAVDRSFIQMSLSDFDALFGMNGAVHSLVVIVDRLGNTGPVKARLKALPEFQNLAVLDWADLTPGLKQSIQLDLVGGIIMYVILVIVVAFSILNTFLMAVFERTREFGVMMAIGTTPSRLVKIMLTESFFMTVVGIVSGMILGAGLTVYFSHTGISMGDASDLMTQYGISGRLYPKLSVMTLLTGPIIIGVITLLTALFPALKIPKLKPVDAMKAV